jgi:hypothetical protein
VVRWRCCGGRVVLHCTPSGLPAARSLFPHVFARSGPHAAKPRCEPRRRKKWVRYCHSV